jgi:hypothetical protein
MLHEFSNALCPRALTPVKDPSLHIEKNHKWVSQFSFKPMEEREREREHNR